MKHHKLIAALYLAFCTIVANGQSTPSCRELVNKMFVAGNQIKSLKFRFKKLERINGKIIAGEQIVKYWHSPRKTYAYLSYPNKGTEVLWVQSDNSGKVLIKPTSFPYFSVNLSTHSDIIRKNNHHTVHEIGFDYVIGIVQNLTQKSSNQFDSCFFFQGETTFDNRPCYKLMIDYKPFQYITYTVKQGETVTSIAERLYLSDYMILQINPQISGYDDIKPGQQIRLPNAYARKTVLYIDKKTYLPIVQKMYDENGLFAQYEFYDLQVNPVIKPEEFNRDYKEYGF
jgi:outer membrane lipoprotein-sorting protein